MKCQNCSNSFCNKLPEELREQLCSQAHRIRYKKRNEQVIFFDFQHVFIIESGYVLTSRSFLSDYQQGTDILEPGNVVGLVQMQNPRYNATINMLPLTTVEGCIVGLDFFEQLVKDNTECALAVVHEYSVRFGRIASKLAIHSYGSASERLRFALDRVRELGLENDITQEDLACLAGLNRVTVSKILNSSKRQSSE